MSDSPKELLEKMQDQVNHAVELLKVARMAAASGADNDALSNFGDPIATLLDVVLDELRGVRDDAFHVLIKGEVANV